MEIRIGGPNICVGIWLEWKQEWKEMNNGFGIFFLVFIIFEINFRKTHKWLAFGSDKTVKRPNYFECSTVSNALMCNCQQHSRET